MRICNIIYFLAHDHDTFPYSSKFWMCGCSISSFLRDFHGFSIMTSLTQSPPSRKLCFLHILVSTYHFLILFSNLMEAIIILFFKCFLLLGQHNSFFFCFLYSYVHTMIESFLPPFSPPALSPPHPLASRQKLFWSYLNFVEETV
jgi:hypothetical protein